MRAITNSDFISKLHTVNQDIEPLEEYVNSRTKLLFKCKICGYEWAALPTTVTKKIHSGCPRCAHKEAALSRRYSD